jgi:hypothetical protein
MKWNAHLYVDHQLTPFVVSVLYFDFQPCTYFTPELFFGDTTALEPIKGVAKAMKGE